MQNLRLELLPEVKFAPRMIVCEENSSLLETSGIRAMLLDYARQRVPPQHGDRNILATVRMKLCDAKFDAGLMHEFAYYAGVRLPSRMNVFAALGEAAGVTGNLAMDIFSDMLVNFDSEGRYALLCAMTAFLRFPDAHTNYFSALILGLFAETPLQSARQQITRVLLERLIVHRPHPWGLLVTFVELIRNPKFSFWQHSGAFLKEHPEVEKVFNNVAATCLGGNPAATDQLRQVIYAAGSVGRFEK
jgi:CCR4-NOT transcription complex subunit 1